MIKLNCPSCGGALELPDKLGIAYCVYCGGKIVLEQTEATREQQSLARYVELCKVALEAKNYDETIQYCNKILEIAPDNVDAWINKATATFWLTTRAKNRYGEAMGYLTKAAQIAADDERILQAREELTRLQAHWYNLLGNESFKHATSMWNIWDHGTAEGKAKATKASLEAFNEAMNYYLLASMYAPEDRAILENIVGTTRVPGKWITWSAAVHKRIESLGFLQAKEQAQARLPKLREELRDAEAALARLRTETGVLVSLKTRQLEGRVSSLKSMIDENEKIASYKASS